jgi:hypothetical protein
MPELPRNLPLVYFRGSGKAEPYTTRLRPLPQRERSQHAEAVRLALAGAVAAAAIERGEREPCPDGLSASKYVPAVQRLPRARIHREYLPEVIDVGLCYRYQIVEDDPVNSLRTGWSRQRTFVSPVGTEFGGQQFPNLNWFRSRGLDVRGAGRDIHNSRERWIIVPRSQQGAQNGEALIRMCMHEMHLHCGTTPKDRMLAGSVEMKLYEVKRRGSCTERTFRRQIDLNCMSIIQDGDWGGG